MNIAVRCVADLDVVGSGGERRVFDAGVLLDGLVDLGVAAAWKLESRATRKGGRVGLCLEVALVHVPVRHVDDQRDHQDQRGEYRGDNQEGGAALVRQAGVKSGPHHAPAGAAG